MKLPLLLPLAIIVALSIHGAECGNSTNETTGEVAQPDVMTSGVASNIAYFHLLYCYAKAELENPLDSLLKLNLELDLAPGAKARADLCLTNRRVTITNNITEFFLVSEFQKHNLSAEGRQRLREQEKEWPNVDPQARVLYSAFYTDQSDLVFDNATKSEVKDLAKAMNGYFSIACDMSTCKEDGKMKSVIVCHATRGIPPKKRIISKAEYERRYGKGDDGLSEGSSAGSVSILMSILVSVWILGYQN